MIRSKNVIIRYLESLVKIGKAIIEILTQMWFSHIFQITVTKKTYPKLKRLDYFGLYQNTSHNGHCKECVTKLTICWQINEKLRPFYDLSIPKGYLSGECHTSTDIAFSTFWMPNYWICNVKCYKINNNSALRNNLEHFNFYQLVYYCTGSLIWKFEPN